jgi:hypothetical protein
MKVFLSSTYQDLVEYRAKAAQAIERLGQQGIRMEVFGARAEEASDACVGEIEASDAFVGIYAHRYGYVPSNSTISITEREFNFAQEKKKPAFCCRRPLSLAASTYGAGTREIKAKGIQEQDRNKSCA